MNKVTLIQNISIRAFLRAGLLLFMSVYISFGHLSQYLDCFEANSIELAEEGDLDPEKEEGKEEIEKNEFLNKLFCCNFVNQQKLHALDNILWKWDHTPNDIPTPPPRTCLA